MANNITISSTDNINISYLITWGGVCKLIQLVLGIICVALSTLAINKLSIFGVIIVVNYELFFFVTTTTFMIGTFILLLGYIASYSTASTITKSIYEFIYHVLACGLLLVASIVMGSKIVKMDKIDQIGKINTIEEIVKLVNERYYLLLTAAICGVVNSASYLLSVVIVYRSYRSVQAI